MSNGFGTPPGQPGGYPHGTPPSGGFGLAALGAAQDTGG
jgi:hypothetical protein